MASVSPKPALEKVFQARRIEQVFKSSFLETYRTQLVGGAEEPYYEPARDGGSLSTIYYRADYFASALHEVAHWCIAGPDRLSQPDFGYWYIAGDRNIEQQRDFEAAEGRPQGLEWIFSRACAYPFRPSADNLYLGQRGLLDTTAFARRVFNEARQWQARGLGLRAHTFYRALCDEFGSTCPVEELRFDLDALV